MTLEELPRTMTDRQRGIQVRETRPNYDRDSYNRGWRSSLDATVGLPLELADARGECSEWYDGYTDAATGRQKWHIPLCLHHHNGEGGCGYA
jgi:hypothetical protein